MEVVTAGGSWEGVVSEILKGVGISLKKIGSPEEVPNVFDGLILLGGGDISPWLYGERSSACRNIDKPRDQTEWIAIRRAMTLGVPIFGICRGMQMIAIAHGAGLIQDIYHPGAHGLVSVLPKLKNWIPDTRVNSYHHQAVRRVPGGFKVLAYSDTPYREIEAIWKPGVLGVQWHPEALIAHEGKDEWMSLFRWFSQGLE